MPITGKERSTYDPKPSLEGTERIIVNGTQYITPAQISATSVKSVNSTTPDASGNVDISAGAEITIRRW